jgi:hypothetical protein
VRRDDHCPAPLPLVASITVPDETGSGGATALCSPRQCGLPEHTSAVRGKSKRSDSVGLFRNLGKKAERFKQQAEAAADEIYECKECDMQFHAEYDQRPECGNENITRV